MTGTFSHTPAAISRRTAIFWLLIPLLLACFAPSLYARLGRPLRHERRHEIDRLEEAWSGAMLRGDASALSDLLAEDFIAITSRGMLQTKAEVLDNLRNGKTQISALNLSDRKVRFYGATAVVTSLAQVQGTNGSENISGNFRYTHVYVHKPTGVWKLVSAEATRIPEPGANR